MCGDKMLVPKTMKNTYVCIIVWEIQNALQDPKWNTMLPGIWDAETILIPGPLFTNFDPSMD